MNGTLLFVLLVIAIITIGDIIKTWLKKQDKQPAEVDELVATVEKIDQLEDRIRVLERIITENRFDLKNEIDSL